MSIFKRQFKKAGVEDSVADADRHSLFMHVSDIGWEMRFTDENGEEGGERRHEDCSLLKVKKPDRMEAIFGRAVKSIKRSDRRRIGSIRILLSDQATIFLDDVGGELQSAGPDIIRKTAEQQLNCRTASYGISELAGAGGSKSLYGMVDA